MFRILPKHANFTNFENKVLIKPYGKAKVVVNGVPIVMDTKLQHLVSYEGSCGFKLWHGYAFLLDRWYKVTFSAFFDSS